MKHYIYLLIVLFAPSLTGFSDVLAKWSASGTSGAQAENPAFMWTSAMTPIPIKRGAGFSSGNVTTFTEDTMAAYTPAGTYVIADAISKDAYFEITLVPSVEGLPVSIESLSFGWKYASRSTGPNTLSVRSSMDNFAADHATIATTTAASRDAKIEFAGTLDNISKPVTLRIYGYGQPLNASGGILAIYNHSEHNAIVVEGTVSGSYTIINDPSQLWVVPVDNDYAGIGAVDTKIISLDTEYYHGWPTVSLGKNGRLHLAYSGHRDYHVCPFGRVEYMYSDNGGSTWSTPVVAADSLTDDRDSGILETKNGVLLASFYTSIAYQIHMNNPDQLLKPTFGNEVWNNEMYPRWQAKEAESTQEQRQADIGYWLSRSTDGGATWSPRYASPPGYAPHGPINLANGRVFYAAANGVKNGAWESTDDGQTWTKLGEIPGRPGEIHAVEAANGTLIAHLRDGGIKQSESKDGGKTWSALRWVNQGNGYPSHLLKLKDNILLMTYGFRAAPYGIRAKISRDNGESWSKELIITNDAFNWDHGYPSTAQLADGSLITVWYESAEASPKAQLRQAKWNLLLVPPLPVARQTVTSGHNVIIPVLPGTPSASSYQWQVSTNGGISWVNIAPTNTTYSGATTAALTITGVTAGMNGYQYRYIADKGNPSDSYALDVAPVYFPAPAGLAFDTAGNLYVSDTIAHTIQKIASDLTVTTFAGNSNRPGVLDGTGAGAFFHRPTALVFNQAGDLFVADSRNGNIRKITSTGAVTTAATGFIVTGGLDLDATGNAYIADSAVNTIYQMAPPAASGAISTYAGDLMPGAVAGTGTLARFRAPTRVLVDHAGHLYIADTGNHVIRTLDASGTMLIYAGLAGTSGAIDDFVADALLNAPLGMTVDTDDNLYFADSGNSTIRRISDGEVFTIAGTPGVTGLRDGASNEALFDHPSDVALDGNGNLYVADTGNAAIRKIELATGQVTTLLVTSSTTGEGIGEGGNGGGSGGGGGGGGGSVSFWYYAALCALAALTALRKHR